MALADVLEHPTTRIPHDGMTAAELRVSLDEMVATVEAMPSTAAVIWCSEIRARFDAVEAAVLARVIDDDDGDDRRARRLARRRGVSKRESRKRTRRGRAVAKNPRLGTGLAAGSLSSEELDLLSEAAAKSDDEALFDTDLIDRVGAAGPDQGKRVVRDWLEKRSTATSADEEYERQRKLRSAWRFRTNDGLSAIAMAGDDALIARLWAQAETHADRLYRADGGREVALGDHPRSNDQRLFDALAGGLIGGDSGSTVAGSSAKPAVVVTVSLDKLVGRRPDESGVQIGVGPIADVVLASYLADGDLVGMLFGTQGQPLWLGRKRRPASLAQHLALTVRDKGCVLCSAPAHRCQAHHLMPWNAPGRGRTDIDQMALLCGPCHRHVHDTKLTVVRDPSTRCWMARPAYAHEIPPVRNGSSGGQRNPPPSLPIAPKRE